MSEEKKSKRKKMSFPLTITSLRVAGLLAYWSTGFLSSAWSEQRVAPLPVDSSGVSSVQGLQVSKTSEVQPEAQAPKAPSLSGANSSLLLVDKKTNLLHLVHHVQDYYQIVKTYHATLGKKPGDKEFESDLKTPEGIYLFQAQLNPPLLQKKFGAMAFLLNYPNSYDQLMGRKGSGIMLHATNEPERLKRDFDSEGCVVVDNQEIQELKSHIRLGLTPILIFSELTPDYLAPPRHSPLQQFFQTWVQAWENKNFDSYLASYHSGFSSQGKNKQAWGAYKSGLNRKYSSIQINPEAIRFYRHPKYSVVTFTQNYLSTLKSGKSSVSELSSSSELVKGLVEVPPGSRPSVLVADGSQPQPQKTSVVPLGHRSRGTKILWIAEEEGVPRIIAENFTERVW